MTFKRKLVEIIVQSIRHTGDIFNALVGPRQVGKTTSAHHIVDALGWPVVIASADGPIPPGAEWIEQHWIRAERG